MPCSTSSSGCTICDSISRGVSARQLVPMPICGRSISGKSWTGSAFSANTPKRIVTATPTATAAGLRMLAGNALQHFLFRLHDLRFDLARRLGAPIGADADLRPVDIREELDGQRVQIG